MKENKGKTPNDELDQKTQENAAAVLIHFVCLVYYEQGYKCI